MLKSKNYSTAVGDEGGFAPNLSGEEEGIELIIEAIKMQDMNPKRCSNSFRYSKYGNV